MNNETLHPKPDTVNTRRRYRSSLRQERAQETRSRILDVARDQFLAHGYVSTTIAAIAREADVAEGTVYAAFGTKRAILTSLISVSIGGDDQPMGVLERPEPQRMRMEPDQRTQLRMMAYGIADILDRAGPMFDVMRIAASTDVDIAAGYAELQEERLRNMTKVVGWVAANGPLKAGLSVTEAAETVWMLTSADVHRMLRIERRWSPERYERWLAHSLIAALLP